MNPQPYYGDVVRKLFISAAILTFLVYPFLSAFLPQQPSFMILAVVILSVMAGLTSSKGHLAVIIDIIISLFAVIFFENHALIYVKALPRAIFVADQILTLIFFFALYYSVKTLRIMIQNKSKSI